ncbi:MAG: hypothetical protein WD492_12505 [Alkalispirochaeta sp.]
MERSMYRFTLFQRNITNSRGETKKVWYAKILDAKSGILIKRISTGMSNKSRAEAAARERITEIEHADELAASL